MAKKILLCEDSAFFAQAISLILKSGGYEVTVAPDGQQGVTALRTPGPDGQLQSFDLILCDIMMPVLDGYGVAQEIKSDETLNQIPLIFLTGVSDMDSMDRAMELGARDYFIKSNVSLDKILDLVKKHIG